MIFVDSSAWIALADSNDRDHARVRDVARRISRGEFGKQVTTNYVLAETVTILRRRLGTATAASFARGIDSSHEIETFWLEKVHHLEAVGLMSEYEDKDWSLTDCTSFIVMRALEMKSAFALDQDFIQAGFTVFP